MLPPQVAGLRRWQRGLHCNAGHADIPLEWKNSLVHDSIRGEVAFEGCRRIPDTQPCLKGVSGPRQFMLDCRPFYVAGFNAHDVVPKSMAELYDHQTLGAQPRRPVPWPVLP